MRLAGLTGAILLLAAMAGSAFAQALPYHADPSAREILPGATALPAIRFLTTADFPPFNFRDSGGELIGFNVDLAKAICQEVNVACTLQAWPWAQATDALSDNQGDALIAGLEMSAANGELFDFSATYMALPGRFVTRHADVAAFSPDALAGKTVAVRRGSAHEAFMKRYLPATQLEPADTELEGLAALQAGDVDVFFGDGMRAAFWINDNLDCCGFAGGAYFRPALFGEGLSIAVLAGNDAVRHAIDWALVRLKDNGVLDELYLRWFPVGFY
ncbi:transporter substrate-binding domain-containing protein [Devosia beringensis]|uniref:transporter substrate-binding domain-containing protein n=1 Tax=Devosia beringensis TaxID=2657486 RepID=UPI00186B641C|nr:transporter substrate-binding domain-containing protein [Devosia beringensis]